jgi:uncharacterized protein YecE (DUF72 family)
MYANPASGIGLGRCPGMTARTAIRIGISGWTYAPWRGVFFPPGLPQKQELSFAAGRFPAIEINGTFYSLQRPDSFQAWVETTPPGFVFSVKGPRFITHMRRLKDVETPLANFLASGLLRLGPKLGPVLWQLPPNFRFDAERLDHFLGLLPHDTEAAAAMAEKHDSRLRGRAWTRTDARRPLRHALEIRHDSFRDAAFARLLRRHRVALVCADTVEWPRLMDVTADFIYCRLHGDKQLYASGYSAQALSRWAKRIAAWHAGGESPDGDRLSPRPGPKRKSRDVFVFFDNDMKVRAPFDAQTLQKKLGLR